MSRKMKAISLFSSAGIGELRIHKNIEVILANELVEKRARCYSYLYPETEMLCGDITDNSIKKCICDIANKEKPDLLIVTPPCQGLSTLGKNKVQNQYEGDRRNYLVLEALEIIDECDFNYILIENVPKFIEMYFPYEGKYMLLGEILQLKYNDRYNIDIRILNAKDYGVPQSRPRAIIRMYKKDCIWGVPYTEKEITLYEAIGHLPSLEPGQVSDIKWHYAKKQNDRAILAMRHTPSGKSALTNEVYYPKKEDGTRIKGFHNTFKRMVWNQPCPARTTYSGSISSHNNVHPGRLLEDGTYSDSRVLTLLETFIVSSIPENIELPENLSETFIRTIIGEAIPPHLTERIIDCIGKED